MFRFTIDSLVDGVYEILECEHLNRKLFREICHSMVESMKVNNFHMCYTDIRYITPDGESDRKPHPIIAHKIYKNHSIDDVYYNVYYKGIRVYSESIESGKY